MERRERQTDKVYGESMKEPDKRRRCGVWGGSEKRLEGRVFESIDTFLIVS